MKQFFLLKVMILNILLRFPTEKNLSNSVCVITLNRKRNRTMHVVCSYLSVEKYILVPPLWQHTGDDLFTFYQPCNILFYDCHIIYLVSLHSCTFGLLSSSVCCRRVVFALKNNVGGNIHWHFPSSITPK